MPENSEELAKAVTKALKAMPKNITNADRETEIAKAIREALAEKREKELEMVEEIIDRAWNIGKRRDWIIGMQDAAKIAREKFTDYRGGAYAEFGEEISEEILRASERGQKGMKNHEQT